jgi:quaternary ammonium compound-resistance protein SugE
MGWFFLLCAGLFEIVFTSCLGKARDTTGTEAYFWYAGFFAASCISLFLLIKATEHIPLGTAYAVWTGIGAAGTVLTGIFLFKDPVTFWRIFFIITLIGSIIGLKIISE